MSAFQPTQMTAPGEVYRQRRSVLAASLRRPLVICAGRAPARNYASNPHPFRAGSTYLYFGGPPLEGAAMLIEPGGDGNGGCSLLRQQPGPDDELWEGKAPADDTLAEAAGLCRNEVADAQDLMTILRARDAAYVSPPCHATIDWARAQGLVQVDQDELTAIVNMRLIKDEHELRAMRQAARVTVEAHRAAMTATKPGRKEADVAAAFMAVLVANGCRPSFTPIVTVRGEVLHGHGYPNVLTDGALMLVDAGAEEPGGYACDVTRTYPVSGTWSDIQRHLYEVVVGAMREAIAACVPGARYREVHDLAGRVICAGLVEAELLKGDPSDLASRAAHTLFFPHGVGHLIGLDVHDMEDFGDLAGYAPGRRRRPEFGHKFLRLDRDLEAGMVVTIEPGIYIVPAIWQRDDISGPFCDVVNRKKVEALLADEFGGIRVEECVQVRDANAPEVLTDDLPCAPDEVTAGMS